jgi:5-methylcytosine-specific restriction endonuclease McrA
MSAIVPSQLPADALAERLIELVGEERHIQVEFLLHLAEFDSRRAWADAGYPSLWEYALRVLHLREGAAWRRISAMRLVRRFPQLADALRDGRLCLSTVGLLGPVLTEANAGELIAAAAFKTKAEVDKLVAGLAPRAAPKDGVRKLPSTAAAADAALPLATMSEPFPLPVPGCGREDRPGPSSGAASASTPPVARPPTVRPVSADAYSLRVTLDAGLKAELDELTALLGHKVPNGDVAAVLRVAVRCAIEKFGKRKGAKDVRKAASAAAQTTRALSRRDATRRAAARAAIPVAIRREVWKRDAGQCTFRSSDGHRCPARTRLEFDHIAPVALGGASTVDNLRLTCRVHNLAHAERVFGHEHMARFRRERPMSTSPGESD